MTQEQKDPKAKLTNPERIRRILQRIVQARMYGLIRCRKNMTVAIKTRFGGIKGAGNSQFLYLEGISVAGRKTLEADEPLQIEVSGMATKLLFVTKIHQMVEGGIYVLLPTVLVSVERRTSTRYQVRSTHAAYLQLSDWAGNASELTAPPVFPEYSDIANWCLLSDISSGGASVMTRFPSVLGQMVPEQRDSNATLIIPGQGPLQVCTEIRWLKRTKERHATAAVDSYQLKFRFGVRFVNLSQPAEAVIKHFIRQLSMAEAI